MVTMQDVKDYVLEQVDLMSLVMEINSYNGSLEDLTYYPNEDDFFEIFIERPMELARAICYGDYHYMDEYVKFNAYGNLVSNNDFGVQQELEDNIDEIIDEMVNVWQFLYLDDELEEMLNELEENGEI